MTVIEKQFMEAVIGLNRKIWEQRRFELVKDMLVHDQSQTDIDELIKKADLVIEKLKNYER